MANTDDTMRAQRARQYQLDRVTAEYVAAYRAGHAPKIEDYVRRHPEYTRELLAFAVDFHTVSFDLPDPDTTPATELSPAAQRAMAWIREQRPALTVAPITGLVPQGLRVGIAPAQLAAAVGLSVALLARLEAHAIAASTIPRALTARLSQTLGVAPQAIAAFFGEAPTAQAGAFYYADKAPEQQQQSFLEAVQASDLAPDAKQEWGEIVRSETGSAP